jgi:hypothetical protein
VTDGGVRVLGRGSSGVLCFVGAATKGTSSTTSSTDEASSPLPMGGGECGWCGVGVGYTGRGRPRGGVGTLRV